MIRNWILTAVVLGGLAAAAAAQPPFYRPPQMPVPPPTMGVDIEGPWYFRGDPAKPCNIETIPGPAGPRLLFTNENGTHAVGYMSRDGRWVTIPEWNTTGNYRGNAIVWPNGDFWGR